MVGARERESSALSESPRSCSLITSSFANVTSLELADPLTAPLAPAIARAPRC